MGWISDEAKEAAAATRGDAAPFGVSDDVSGPAPGFWPVRAFYFAVATFSGGGPVG